MAPIKLEDNIREKLEARELKPSKDAWKKLETKLDKKQPKRKPVLWYYAAASFVGLLIVGSVFFSRNNTEGNRIVEENAKETTVEKQTEIVPKRVNANEIATDENKSEKVNSEEKQKQAPNLKLLPIKKESAVDKQIQKSEAIAKTSVEEIQKPVTEKKPALSEDEKLFNNKVEEVVASVKKLQHDKSEVTEADVLSLLENARRDIQTQRILNSPKIDATALLQDVEWEMEKSFRDKVFDALGEGFQKVRTAVSERND